MVCMPVYDMYVNDARQATSSIGNHRLNLSGTSSVLDTRYLHDHHDHHDHLLR